MIDEKTLKTTDRLAREYYNRYDSPSIMEKYRQIFLNLINDDCGILDVGCGSGRDIREFAKTGHITYGIDVSENTLKIAKKQSPRTKFYKMDMENIQLPIKFSGIWCCASIYHIPKNKIKKVLDNFHKYLIDGGVLFMALKEGKTEGHIKRDLFGGLSKYYSLYEDIEIMRKLKDSGFNTVMLIKEYKDQDWINIFAYKKKYNEELDYNDNPTCGMM